MSKDEKLAELREENQVLRQQKELLEFELKNLKRIVYGSKKERFVPISIDANQGDLFTDDSSTTAQEKTYKEDTTKIKGYERKKTGKKHNGRNELPEHLPTEIRILEPDVDTTGMKHIGYEESITLDYTPSALKKIITRRNKYLITKDTPLPITNRQGEILDHMQITEFKADESIILISDPPSRPIPKSIAEASLLAHIIVCKFIDHLPFYRQIQRFKRDYNWDLPSSTINDW